MKLFLDTSVLLAACGSAHGSSRALFGYAPAQGWTLMASPWVVAEVVRNLATFPPAVASPATFFMARPRRPRVKSAA